MIAYPVSFRGITAVMIVLIGFMVFYMYQNMKEKPEYDKTTGRIAYLDKQLGNLPFRDLGKYRYLIVEGYSYPFEIFIGSDAGDFKPKFEQIDNLHRDDTVTVYYYETDNTRGEGINRFMQYIDKKSTSFFELGNSARTTGIIIITLCILVILGAAALWKFRKIPF